MSLFISETIEWLKNLNTPFQVNGGSQLDGGVKVTGSLSVIDESAVGSGTLGAPVLVLSGSGTHSGGYVSGSIGIQLTIGMTSSLAGGNPTAAQLTSMFPNVSTGSLLLVGSGSESWLVFKDIKGTWRTMTASLAA